MPCSQKRARKLLACGRARVHRLYPFTIRLVDLSFEACKLQPLRLSIDPGSRVTGICVARVEPTQDADPVMHITFLLELVHRGQAIRDALLRRAAFRRRRRGANLRHRAPRFDNRRRTAGWLAPSLQHRVGTTIAWVTRLRRLAPITHLAQELVRFDTQLMQDAEIRGAQYQQGELAGYEVREYLLEKLGRSCQYCDATGVPLDVEHIVPRSRGGSDRVSNLTLACRCCNERKGNRSVEEFLAHDPVRAARIKARAKAPLKDAAAVNATRLALFGALRDSGLTVEAATGGRTKYNRVRLGIAKTHALDAACAGTLSDVRGPAQPALQVTCTGRGSRCRTRVDSFGLPRGYLMREKSVHGFRTGDMVLADVPSGKKAGAHVGRVAVRRTGSFNLQTDRGVLQGISHRHCKLVARGDGYRYGMHQHHNMTTRKGAPLLPALKDRVSAA